MPRLSPIGLSTKSLLLISIPVFFELACVGALYFVMGQNDLVRAKAAHCADLCARVNHSFAYYGRLQSATLLAKMTGVKRKGTGSGAGKLLARSLAEIQEIDALVADDPEESKSWARVKHGARDCHEALKAALELQDDGEPEEFARSLKNWQRKLAKMSALADALIERERELENEQNAKAAEYTAQIKILLPASILLGFFATALLAWLFNRSISTNLSRLTQNARAMAAGRPPEVRVGGNDELEELSKIYGGMYESLAVLRARERAVLDNAAEGICSMDEELRFTEVNPALERMLSASERDLLGSRLAAHIRPADFAAASKIFAEARDGGDGGRKTFQVAAAGESGAATMAWSVVWTEVHQEYCCVVQDVTEAARLEQLKGDFVAMVGHDLRAPLTSIALAHELLAEENISAESKDTLVIAQGSIKRLLALVNNLLDLDKLEAGLMQIDQRERELFPVVDSSVKSLAMLADQKKLKVSIRMERGLKAYFDPDKISQVLINILSNAYKFSEIDKPVKVEVDTYGHFARVMISDLGPGVSTEKQKKIFEKFEQVGAPDAARGSGLGLAICKAIVEKHGGEIGVKSQPGFGSTFWFTLPLSQMSALNKP